MASERQIAANRRNALRSTGPKSVEGLQRATRNAVRHGLSVPVKVDAEVIAVWRMILEDEAAVIRPAMSNRERAALELARAEVQLARARRVEGEIDARTSEMIRTGELARDPSERGYRAVLKQLGLDPTVADDPEHFIHSKLRIQGGSADRQESGGSASPAGSGGCRKAAEVHEVAFPMAKVNAQMRPLVLATWLRNGRITG